MGFVARYVGFLQDHSRATIAVVLVLSLVVGSGAAFVDGGFVIAGFESDSPEAEAADYVEANFGDRESAPTLLVLRDVDGETALSKGALLESLEVQRQVREDPAIAPTLTGDAPTVGIANVVGVAAVAEDREGPPRAVGIEDKRAAIEARSDEEVAELVADVTADPDRDLLRLLPSEVALPASEAGAHVAVVTHDVGEPVDPEEPPPSFEAAQLAVGDVAEDYAGEFDHFAFGPAIVDDRGTEATGESFALIGPLMLVLVVGFLVAAYRDLLDVLLALCGVVLVLLWTGGFIGWLGIEVTQILVAAPFLLVGLSIDYALHVVMRYREERADSSVRTAAFVGFTGVVVAIGATTVTTAVGFFSNLTSGIPSISDFGLVSGLGILAAFVVFGALLPAAKYELESTLERRGWSRSKRAFGTVGPLSRVLGVGTTLARKAPVVLVALVLAVSLAGAYGAVNVDTEIDQNDFLPDDRPGWMDHVPEPFRPGEYAIREHALFLQANFAGADANSQADVLIQGDVTDADSLRAAEAAGDAARASGVTFVYADGEAAVDTPVDVLERIAREDDAVAEQLSASDTSGDGVPDTDVEALFDAAFDADPEAMGAVVARGDAGYEALRLDVTVRGDARGPAVLTEMRAVAAVADEPAAVTATATGPLLLLELVQEEVLATLVTTFAVTLTLVGAFLTLLFWRRHGSLALGPLTMVPVLVALSWILGVMYLLGIPYNSETAIITAIAIGIGVDFAIHVTERFLQERDRLAGTVEALSASVAGTGGAILASAATTTVGFGILTLTLVPSLQRFGLVTGLTIVFAFVASVLVLPSLLLLWDRHTEHEHDAMIRRA